MTKPRSVAATANDNSIPGSRLENNSVTADKLNITAGAIPGSAIEDGTVTAAKLDLQAGDIPGSTIEDGTISGAKIASDAGIDSEKLAFLLNQTGAVLRSVESRLADEVWVTDFGAVEGNDNALAPTNTAAFLAAIETGRPIRVPAGIFVVNSMDVTSKISGFPSITLKGAGLEETTIKRIGGGATFYSTATMTLDFSDLSLVGNNEGSSIHWDYTSDTGRNRFDNVYFKIDEYGLNVGCVAVSWTVTNCFFNGLTYARKFSDGAWAYREYGNYTWYCIKGLWVQKSGFSNSVLSSVFEYNSQEAVIIEGNAAGGAEIAAWLFESVFFESNANTTAVPIIDIKTTAAHRIRCVTFDNCYFTFPANATYICQIAAGGGGTIGVIAFRNNFFNAAGLPVTNSNSSRVIFENNNHFSDAYGASFSTAGIRDANLWPVTVPYGNKGRVFPSQVSAPTTPNPGETYFDTSTNKLRCWDGTSWNDLF